MELCPYCNKWIDAYTMMEGETGEFDDVCPECGEKIRITGEATIDYSVEKRRD